MIWRWLKGNETDPADLLYAGLAEAARRHRFYADWGVPDTVDGRFEMVSLHMFLALDRLKQAGGNSADVAQKLADTFFDEMDRALREMGAGDLTVGKKVRRMAEAFYGRAQAYATAMREGQAQLEQALARNVFPDGPAGDVKALADWFLNSRSSLLGQPDGQILAGKIDWP